ncbi:UBX domain protein 8 [Desmophyllum pertusum]|uniref:UBX domain protein 8 n=1 Tax=Desmophyllum pertusum TaxID=174260 RepID=A0A9W9ZFI3_9CNID|nr:UBX domain protein 8 [Desmophyllum pertusum]
MAFDKTWIVLIAGCGVLSLAFWSGMNAFTLKMTLLWMFISFGFLTLIMHLFGSPISIVLHKLFHTADQGSPDATSKFTDAELKEKRQRALEMKQFLQDNKVDIYKENILGPREEILKAKREAEFYKFNSTWRGKGQKLGNHGEEQAEHDVLSQEFLMHEDTSSEDGTDIEQSQIDKEAINNSEYTDDAACESTQEQNGTESLRQRTNRPSCVLPEEPHLKEKGVITVALRCPDGAVKKRRFTVESQIKMLFTFAEWLGFSPSRHVILTTYPRKQLSDITQTLNEAGLTHDTALVLEEI